MEIKLRTLERYDLACLRDWRNQMEIRGRSRQYRLLNMDDQERWWERQSQDPTIQMFGIVHSDLLIGVCGLTNVHWVNRTAEISIYIGSKGHTGKGVGTATLGLLEDIAFEEYNLRRLWAEIYEFNNVSIGLFEKCGFTREGAMCEHIFWNGRYHDAYIYGKLRP